MGWTFTELDDQPTYRIQQLVELLNLESEIGHAP